VASLVIWFGLDDQEIDQINSAATLVKLLTFVDFCVFLGFLAFG